MATWTSAQLATDVLKRLGVTGAGQSASAEDSAVVTDAWVSIHPQLRRLGLAPWGSGAIDEGAQQPLSKYVAGEVYGYWGFTGAREAQIVRDAATGFSQLTKQAAADRTALPVRPRFF